MSLFRAVLFSAGIVAGGLLALVLFFVCLDYAGQGSLLEKMAHIEPGMSIHEVRARLGRERMPVITEPVAMNRVSPLNNETFGVGKKLYVFTGKKWGSFVDIDVYTGLDDRVVWVTSMPE